jgi:hypothetical protein
MRNHLGVAVGSEVVAAGFESFPPLGVVEQLAIENDSNVACLVGNRLSAILETDNAEPTRNQADARPNKDPVFVRAAVYERGGHRLK